jgi:glycosyltransferase involved in cell wall biosynthesis
VTGKHIAILVWGLKQGAFANVAAALSRVFCLGGASEVSVLYLHQDPGPDITFPEQVKLVRLGKRRAITAIPAIARQLSISRPDVIITLSTLMAIPGILGWRLSGTRPRGTRLVIYQCDTLQSDVLIDHANDLRMRLMPPLARLLFPLADAMVVAVPGLVDLLRRDVIPIPGGAASVIPIPVDVDSFRRRAGALPSHAPIPGPILLTSVGRLVRRKNFPLLLRALSRVRERFDARLVIFGEGPERARIEREIISLGLSGAVELRGFVDNPFAEIARSDLFVMPSLDEAFCLALVEAMACGVPVVATDAVGGGPRAILEGGEHGLLIRSDDEEALAEALAHMLSAPTRRAELGALASRRADAFAPHTTALRWARFLDGLGLNRGAAAAAETPGTRV